MLTPEDSQKLDETRIAGESAGNRASQEGAPARIGPYRIIRRLGGGGMGTIYLAEQESVGRQVALKVLPPGFFEGSEAHDRFQREVQVLGRLSHPHICPVLEAGRDGDTQYYAMEHIRGLDLAKVIRTQRIDPIRAAEIAVQVLRALQFAHERGVLHRDVKPHNIMVSRGARPREASTLRAGSSRLSLVKRIFGGESKEAARTAESAPKLVAAEEGMPGPEWSDRAILIDFGLARDEAKRSTKLTMTGAVVGTPAYMAPEQARGSGAEIGPACDVYAMGAVLYEMLALRPPFEGETIAAILHQVVEADPRPLRSLNPLLDRDLETIVAKAMDKVPSRRYESAGAFAEDLERWAAGEPILARPASLPYRLRKVIGRNRLASAALAVVLAIGGAATWRALAPGTLRIESDPTGAEVWLEGSLRGATPLALRASPGERRLELRLAGYESEKDFPVVTSGQESRIARTLRHEKGYLTLTSFPEEARLDLEGGGRKVTTASPSTEFPLNTGHWEGIASAANCFPRRVSFDLAREDRISRHLTLNEMRLWQFISPNGAWECAVVEATGDVLPDLAVVYDNPGRLSALRGVDGAVLWTTALREWRIGVSGFLGVADFDGDLRDEILWAGGGGKCWVYEAETGRLKATFSLGFGEAFLPCADVDGDGLQDLAGWGRGLYGVVSGLTGALIWKNESPGNITALRRARMGNPPVPALLVSAEGFGPTAAALKDGSILWCKPGKLHGCACAADFTGDGIDDAGLPFAPHNYRVLSGKDGAEVWSREFEGMGYRGEDAAGDVNGDGCAEVVRGGADNHRVVTISGATGDVISSVELQTAWSSAALVDVAGDARPEIVIGSNSSIVALDPRAGEIVWKYDDGRSDCLFALLADFDGDGRQDVASVGGACVSVLRAVDRPVLWSQRAGGYNVKDVAPVGEPASWLIAPGYPLLLLDIRDGRIAATSRAGAADFAMSRTGANGPDAILQFGSGAFQVLVPGMEIRTIPGSPRDSSLDLIECTGDGFSDLLVVANEPSPSVELYDGATFALLWKSALRRAGRGLPATGSGRIWVPGTDGVHVLDAKAGRLMCHWRLGGSSGSVGLFEGDAIAATTSGTVARGKLSPDGASVEIVWSVSTGLSLSDECPLVLGPWVALLSTDGVALLLDGRTGKTRWRTAPLGRVDGGPALCDLDRDGLPEVALCQYHGWVVVLSGTDGSVLLRHRQGSEFGRASGVWSDTDGDGIPELIVLGRSGFASALKVPLRPSPVLCRPSRWERSLRDYAEPSLEANAMVRGQSLLDRGDSAGFFALAESTPTAWVCWNAALAARRLDDATATLRWSEEARRRGVRRLDVDLARAGSLPSGQRSAAVLEALSAASADQLEESMPDDEIRALWNASAADAAVAAVRAGRPDSALLILAFAGRWEDAETHFNQASLHDRGRMLLARGAAAARASRWPDVLWSYGEAVLVASSHDEGLRRLSLLQSQTRAALDRGRACCEAGRIDEAIPHFEKALGLQPDDAERWNEAAWSLAIAPGVTPAHGRTARGWAEAAVATHQRAAPADGATLSLYLDTLAAAHFAAGEPAEAARVEREALALPVPAKFLGDMKAALEKYEKAAGGGR